jgi:hypothetical protein
MVWSRLVRSSVAIIWDMVPCSLHVNCCFGGTYHLHLQGRKTAEPESAFLLGRFSTQKIQVKCSSTTPVPMQTTRSHIPQDGNTYSSHCCWRDVQALWSHFWMQFITSFSNYPFFLKKINLNFLLQHVTGSNILHASCLPTELHNTTKQEEWLALS